jgi:hypothetical protein
MLPDNAGSDSRLVRSNSVLPPAIETAIRRFLVDKQTGNLQLNIKDGRILSFHENRIQAIP